MIGKNPIKDIYDVQLAARLVASLIKVRVAESESKLMLLIHLLRAGVMSQS